jgi:hypothetical protein
VTELETVHNAERSSTAGLEALPIKNLLESNGIEAAPIASPFLPNLPFEVKLPAKTRNARGVDLRNSKWQRSPAPTALNVELHLSRGRVSAYAEGRVATLAVCIEVA